MIEQLSLMVPGLLAPVRAAESRHPTQGIDLAPLRALFRHCRDRQAVAWPDALADATMLPDVRDPAALAVALGLPPASAWLFAAPVLLRPDHAGIYLLGSRPLQLNADQARVFCSELNAWLQQDGMRLYPVSPSCWLLALPAATELQWPALADAVGRDLRQLWPQGEHSLRWQSRLTEWQMLLNQSPCNQQRQHQGLPPVHALWLWGEPHRAPRNASESRADSGTNRVLVQPSTGTTLLAQLNGQTATPTLAEWLQTDSRHAVVIDERFHDAFVHGDVAGFQSAWSTFLTETLTPIQQRWQRGEIGCWQCYPDDGHVYRFGKPRRWPRWRRAVLPAVLEPL